MKPWAVPDNLFRGKAVAILASGSSMSQAVADQVRAAGVAAIAVNTTFRLAPWADLLYAADAEWWEHRENAAARQFAGLRVSVGAVRGVHRLFNSGVDGFDPTPGCVRTGGNSGFQAVHIALQAGARRILLCGFDMRGGHWHGEHPSGLRSTTAEVYARWVERFATLRAPAAGLGCAIVNCTPGSAVTCFPMASLESELDACAVLAA